MLDQLIKLDVRTNKAYYEMGQILYAFRQDRLYKIIGYDSFALMVEEELTFSKGTASNYAAMYNIFKRLHYNKTEALELLSEYGMTHMREVLRNEKNKIGKRAIQTRIDALDTNQINFTLTDAELAESHTALETLGAVVDDNGRYVHSSEAFIAMVRMVNGIKKAA